MSQAANTSADCARGERWLWLLLAAAWFINFGFSLVGWSNTIVSRFEFRQAQTALSTAHFPAGTFPLAYETPVFGPPWSVPLEFPLYEACVANFSAATGLPLDPSGRLVSWFFFQLSLPAWYLVLSSAGASRAARLIGVSLVLTSPLYLFFSRAFLIESTALCFSAWFLAAYARWLTTPRWGWLAVAAGAGALGACIKVTTMVVFGAAALLFTVREWVQRRRATSDPGPSAGRTLILRSALAFALPMLAGVVWLVFSTAIRERNPDADILKTHFGFWSFGDLPQRLSLDYWYRTVSVWTKGIISEGGLILGLYLFLRHERSRRTLASGLFLAFLSGQLIFSNLYKVHDYYFYASGVFLIGALAVLLGDEYANPQLPRWGRLALPVAIIVLQLSNYSRDYLPDQRRNQELPELAEALRDITRPDDMVVIVGLDWDATVPYYAGRKALMFVNGREWPREGMKRSIDRLDPAKVGAAVVVGGFRSDADFVNQTMAHLDLGPIPVLVSNSQQIGVWIPRAKQAAARDRLPLRPYPTLDVVFERPAAGASRIIGLREISQRREFDRMSPRPFQAHSPSDFSTSLINRELVLNAHAPTELAFHVPPHARRVMATFGIDDGAFTGKERTDGVEFVVVHRSEGAPEKILYRRLLDPAAKAQDQGRQELDFALDDSNAGELIFRTQPGPRGNFSFDWAYWGKIEIR